MTRIVLLALLVSACAHHPQVKVIPCSIPSPPSTEALAAAPGLIGRDALLRAYVASVTAAKRACR